MNRNRLLIGAAALLLIWIGGNLALHFGQKHHDILNYNIDQVFPPDKPTEPGGIYASTLAAIMDHELHTGFGWRPNDLYIWGPKVGADNNADRQLGIIQAVRETTRIFKDHLTKVSSNQYDPNLVIADTDFRNDALKWILPSPEGKYDDGIEHLRMYVAGLHSTPPSSRQLNTARSSYQPAADMDRPAGDAQRISTAPPRTTAPRCIAGTATTTSITRRDTRT